jgi:hypothetical protein
MIDALVRHLGYSKWWLCPNMMIGHNEADLLAISKTGWAYEWEIKCSLPDWKNDLKKGQHGDGSRSRGVAYFNYAVHEAILPEDLSWVPDYAGIVTVADNLSVNRIRNPKRIHGAVEWDRSAIWRLCYYRFWNLRDKFRGVVLPAQEKMDRVNESLQALMHEVEERNKVPSGLFLPDKWKKGNGALEKRSEK